MPSTWHETGLSVFGTFGRGYGVFDYQAMIVAGLNANGFDRDTWIASGKQGFFETDNFTCPGYAARLDWRGVPGLRTGVSFYYCPNTGANSDKSQTYSSYGKIPVEIFLLGCRIFQPLSHSARRSHLRACGQQQRSQ